MKRIPALLMVILLGCTQANVEESTSLNIIEADEAIAERPGPINIGGETIRWIEHQSVCPDGWHCSPCWLPEPAQVEDDDGDMVVLPSVGCYSPVYVSSAGETLADIAEEADASVDELCVEDELAERPDETLPAEIPIRLC